MITVAPQTIRNGICWSFGLVGLRGSGGSRLTRQDFAVFTGALFTAEEDMRLVPSVPLFRDAGYLNAG